MKISVHELRGNVDISKFSAKSWRNDISDTNDLFCIQNVRIYKNGFQYKTFYIPNPDVMNKIGGPSTFATDMKRERGRERERERERFT